MSMSIIFKAQALEIVKAAREQLRASNKIFNQ